jgi:hypothetical protein
MQVEKIRELINNQVSFDSETLSQLSNVIEEHPYFQTAHLLYTLNLQANKDMRLASEIRKTACYAGDRKKFFYLIEKDFATFWFTESEEEKKQSTPDSSFDLVDRFLVDKEKEMKKESVATLSGSQAALTDYMSYFFSEETQNQESNVTPMRYQEAIDRFISEDEKSGIKIVLNDREAKEEFIPETHVEQEIGNNFFSETLAKIYLKQKKYKNALEIIIKLSLVYPEKNVYFADQIRFLEKLIINTKK